MDVGVISRIRRCLLRRAIVSEGAGGMKGIGGDEGGIEEEGMEECGGVGSD